MRMRKKKNLDVRFAACADVMVFEPKQLRGKWRALFGNDNPLHLEIGCGKGTFTVETAAAHPEYNSVIGSGVTIEEGAVVRDSIIMNNSVIGKNTIVNKSIIAEEVVIGDNVELGVGEEVPNVKLPKIYNSGLVTIGECSVVPDGVKVGKNTAISGVTTVEDYPDGLLPSGGIIIKAGEVE